MGTLGSGSIGKQLPPFVQVPSDQRSFYADKQLKTHWYQYFSKFGFGLVNISDTLIPKFIFRKKNTRLKYSLKNLPIIILMMHSF